MSVTKVQKSKPKVAKKAKKFQPEAKASWMAVGFDVGYASISAGAFAFDRVRNQRIGPVAVSQRWDSDVDYFDRLKFAAFSYSMVHDLMNLMKITAELDEVHIVVEQAAPLGKVKAGVSRVITQQIQMSGSLIGGLLRWGWVNIREIPANEWRKMVADDLAEMLDEDITIHTTKWSNPELESEFHCEKKCVGKFRAKQWCGEKGWVYDWPDIISDKRGLIPRPEGRKAKARQSDDRYEAIAMAELLTRDLRN